MQKLGCVLPSALCLFLAFAIAWTSGATEVLSVNDKKIEIRETSELKIHPDQYYYVLDSAHVRRGIVKIENIIDDVAFGELMMGSAEPQMKLEKRTRNKSARRSRGNDRSPASTDEGVDSPGEQRSDYWWTPKPGSFSVAGRLAMASATYSPVYSGKSYSVSESATSVGTSVLYSFSPRFSLGLLWDISNSNSATIGSYNLSRSGPADPQLSALYQNKDGDAVYFFGLTISASLGPYKPAGLDTPGNFSSGGIGIIPTLGLMVHTADHYFGARLSYEYRLPATIQSSSNSSTYQQTGGNVVGLEMYYEYHTDKWILSPIIGFASHDSSTVGGSSSGGTDPYTVPHWKLKAVYAFAPQISGSLAVISQQSYVGSDADTPVYTTAYGGEAGLRYEF